LALYQCALLLDSSAQSNYTVGVTGKSQQKCDEGVKEGISNKEAIVEENDGMTSDDSIDEDLG